MDTLTPELERRLQVEELWARRNVLCESMNERRQERFRARFSMLSRLGTDMPAPLRPGAMPAGPAVLLAAQPMRPAAQSAPSFLHGFLRLGGVAAVAGLIMMIALQGGDLFASVRGELAHAVPGLVQMIWGSAAPPAANAPLHAVALPARHQDLRAEVAARIAAAVAGRH